MRTPINDCAAGVMSSCMIAKESLSLILRSQSVIEGRPESNCYSWCCNSAFVAPASCFFVLCSSRTTCHSELYSTTALFLVSMVSRKASSYVSVSDHAHSGIIFLNCSCILLMFSLVIITLTAPASSRATLLSLLLEMAPYSDSRILPQVVTCLTTSVSSKL